MKAHGRRRALRTGVVAATALVLAGAAAGAVLESRLDDNVINACRNKSTGVLRCPRPALRAAATSSRCSGTSAALPDRRACRAGVDRGAPRHRVHDRLRAAGRAASSEPKPGGVVTFTCRPAPPSEALPNVVLNEIDYDQVGADADGFVELYNAGLGAAELDGLALVFVDGADGGEYLRKPLTGALAPGAYLVVPVEAQNGAPDGVALFDTATRASSTRSRTKARSSARSSGRSPTRSSRAPRCRRPSPTRTRSTGSLARIPNGSDTDDAATDWAFTTTVTPGEANVRPASAAPSRACSRAPPRRPWPSACAPRPGGACRAAARGARARAAASCSSPSGRTAACRPRAPPGSRSPARCRGRSPRSGTALASSSTSPNVSARPSDDSQSCSSRSPGVSTTSPPPGSRTSWRCLVVCRPSPSCSRIVCVASSSSPASVFTSVDLPTPDEPSSAIVRPGSEVGADQVEAVAGQARDRVDRHAEGDRLDLEHLQRVVRDRGRSSSARSRAGRRSPTPSSRSARGGGG